MSRESSDVDQQVARFNNDNGSYQVEKQYKAGILSATSPATKNGRPTKTPRTRNHTRPRGF